MPKQSTRTDRPKMERECKLHGMTMHVSTIRTRNKNGDPLNQWWCMVCRNELNRAWAYKKRRELNIDTRDAKVAPLAPLVDGAQRPAAQAFTIAS